MREKNKKLPRKDYDVEFIRELCDRTRKSSRWIRHAGYYDSFGRILYDSMSKSLAPLEGEEEMHILNGTVASMLNLWRPADYLLGKVESFVMVREKIVGLILPRKNQNYILVIFGAGTPSRVVERIKANLMRALP